MKGKAIIIIVLLLGSLQSLNAQHRLGRAGYFKTFDYVRLAHSLTDNVESDSLKVKSIYLWMTKHIRYDMGGYFSGSGSYTDPNDILRHRTAVCLGISILFDSLCSVAGIQSEVVWGYVYEPWYEGRDTIFLDTHAWNVVQIDGEWKLVDVTWAAGSLQQRRQPLRRLLWKWFKIPYGIKYRNKRKRNDFYYCTPPEKFVLDHLPSTPAWQLLDCSVPMDSFQMSPTATQHFLDAPVNCRNGNDSIAAITGAVSYKKWMVSGQQALAFNKHNHQDISFGMRDYGYYLFTQAEDTDYDYKTRIAYYDSCLAQLDSMSKSFLATAKDCRDEGAFFVRRNKRMNRQLLNEDKPLIKKKSAEERDWRKQRQNARRMVRKLQSENKKLGKASTYYSRKRIKISRPKKPNDKEADRIDKLVDHLGDMDDRISDLTDSASNVAFPLFADLAPQYMAMIDTLDSCAYVQLIYQRSLVVLRAYYFNSFDTVVIVRKDHVMKLQHEEDSIRSIIPGAGMWAADSAANVYKKNVKKIQLTLKDEMQACSQLGKMSKSGYDEKQKYIDCRRQYVAWNDSVISYNNQLIRQYNDYAGSLGSLEKKAERSAKYFQYEVNYENMRFRSTTVFFRMYYGGHANSMKMNSDTCKKLKRIVASRKKQLEAKHRKEMQQKAKS
ncbi:MAG TPA: transglutaminase domain-containing protein [Bacteroidia bacterium]|nr:transglutaminase domain-containing protein [Bacteroidia bacterium]